jgi:peptidoglycan/xylan/chitin deacetylase (PgdA/CDA1 family)
MASVPISRRRLLQAAAQASMALSLGPSWLVAARPAVRATSMARAAVPEIISHADPSVSSVYLTIDDWFDREMVELALDIAARERVALTFFPIGRYVGRNADLVRRAAREGHELENHTWDHQRLDLGHCPIAKIPGEIEAQFIALRNILGPTYRQHFLRPPGGFGILGGVNPYLVQAAQQAGLRIAMWSTDSRGWRAGRRSDPAAIDYVLANVDPGLVPGGIILQHAIPDDVLALPAEIAIARERGLRMTTMAEGILRLPGPTNAPPPPTPIPQRPSY